MTNRARSECFRPFEAVNSLSVYLPVPLSGGGEITAPDGHVVSLAQQMGERKSEVERRVAEVNYFMIEEHQLVPVDEDVLRAVIAVHERQAAPPRVFDEVFEKAGRRRGNSCRADRAQ